jgi:hypothetical protein
MYVRSRVPLALCPLVACGLAFGMIAGASHVANCDRPEAYMQTLRSWFERQRL